MRLQGEIWNWSLLGVKGLTILSRCPIQPNGGMSLPTEVHCCNDLKPWSNTTFESHVPGHTSYVLCFLTVFHLCVPGHTSCVLCFLTVFHLCVPGHTSYVLCFLTVFHLLADLIKRTDKSNPDHKALSEAVEVLKEAMLWVLCHLLAWLVRFLRFCLDVYSYFVYLFVKLIYLPV